MLDDFFPSLVTRTLNHRQARIFGKTHIFYREYTQRESTTPSGLDQPLMDTAAAKPYFVFGIIIPFGLLHSDQNRAAKPIKI